MSKPRLLLVDDHRMVREAVARVLSPVYEIVGTAADGDEMLKLLAGRVVDCVLLDLDLPGLHGLELIKILRRRHPGLRVVILTMHAEQVQARAAIREGAHGFVPKGSAIDELLRAIEEVCAGRRYVSPDLSRARHRMGSAARHPALRRLTPRQQEILLLLGEGRSAAGIARKLGVGESTIAFHKTNIARTLGLATKESLLSYAVMVRMGDGMDAGGGG